MTNINTTILVPIDLAAGSTAINYTPTESFICPVLSLICVGASGAGDIKITPYRSSELSLVSDTGSGGRLRVTANAIGELTAVEIAAGGTGYTAGAVTVEIIDPYGTGGSIACTASGGAITGVSIAAPGRNYSGYVIMDVSDFIEGVSYDFMPRYIEQTSGVGVLKLFGVKLSYRPYQVF